MYAGEPGGVRPGGFLRCAAPLRRLGRGGADEAENSERAIDVQITRLPKFPQYVGKRLDEIAKAEGVSQSHVSRMLRLTLLAPEIVEAILAGRQRDGMRLELGRTIRGSSPEQRGGAA